MLESYVSERDGLTSDEFAVVKEHWGHFPAMRYRMEKELKAEGKTTAEIKAALDQLYREHDRAGSQIYKDV